MRFAVFSQKGGVGKSTIAVNLAAVASVRGERTLLVDLDPQADATRYLLGPEEADARPNLSDLFEDALSFHLLGSDPHLYVHPTPYPKLDVIPSHAGLRTLLPRLRSRDARRVREVVDNLGYQTVFFDTPPADDVLTESALAAADRVLIPFDCDDFAGRGIASLIGRVQAVREAHNPRLRLSGIVVNQFQCRASFPRQAIDQLREQGLPVLQPYLSSSVRIRESHFAARPMPYYEPCHRVTAEFESLYDRVRTSRGGDARSAELANVAG